MMKRISYAIKQIPRPVARKILRDCLLTEKMSRDEIASINWQRRMALLRAAAKTPFYRERFASIGLEPGDVKSEKDWEAIPILTRQDVQDNMERMVRDDVDVHSLGVTSTGGSTGQPLKLYRPKNLPYDSFSARMIGWWGIEMWENSAYIFRHGYSGLGKVINDLKWWPTRRAFLNAANMDEAKCAEFYQTLLRIRPRLLVGYVGAVSRFAEFMVEHKLSFPFQLKAVWTTSAPLPEPLRANLRSVFNAPVYSQYGCCEVAHLAAECSCCNGMHINSDWRHIEIVDQLGHGQPVGTDGDVLISDMLATEVPVIRYALGDRGRMKSGACSCGINLPMMEPVKGRVSEAFPLPDGSKISGDYLTTIFDRYPDSIRGFRVHQNKDYSILVEYVVRNADAVKMAIEDARSNLQGTTKGQVSIAFNEVQTIPHDRGKTRYVTTGVRS